MVAVVSLLQATAAASQPRARSVWMTLPQVLPRCSLSRCRSDNAMKQLGLWVYALDQCLTFIMGWSLASIHGVLVYDATGTCCMYSIQIS